MTDRITIWTGGEFTKEDVDDLIDKLEVESRSAVIRELVTDELEDE